MSTLTMGRDIWLEYYVYNVFELLFARGAAGAELYPEADQPKMVEVNR